MRGRAASAAGARPPRTQQPRRKPRQLKPSGFGSSFRLGTNLHNAPTHAGPHGAAHPLREHYDLLGFVEGQLEWLDWYV
jgi:hypothetical protein